MAKKKFETITTPVGEFNYPYLSEPLTKGQYVKGEKDYKYKVTLILDSDDPATEELIDKIEEKMSEAEEIAKEALKEKYPKKEKFTKDDFKEVGGGPSYPFKQIKDDAGEPTGQISLTASKKARRKMNDGSYAEVKLKLYDSKGQIIPNSSALSIYSGTTGRLNISLSPYHNNAIGYGVSVRLSNAQILNLVDSFEEGFDALDDEDGFSVDTIQQKIESKAEDNDGEEIEEINEEDYGSADF